VRHRPVGTLAGVTIVPDTKDWTWVLHRPCEECGFDTRSVPREQIAALLLANAERWPGVLADAERARRRTRPDRWSLLEYACHVRDVLRLGDYRLGLMLTEEDPTYPGWDQDAAAIEDRYGDQEPTAVAAELVAAARRIAASLATVSDAQWERTGVRGDGVRFTVESFARYVAHDTVHHLYDVTGERHR